MFLNRNRNLKVSTATFLETVQELSGGGGVGKPERGHRGKLRRKRKWVEALLFSFPFIDWKRLKEVLGFKG